MPKINGFEMLELVDEQQPAVIFTTAFDEYAIKAFEAHATDYLLKPFDRERFQTALARALNQIKREQSGALTERLSALLADLKPESTHPDRIVVKADGRISFLKTDDVDWIEAADNYVNLRVGTESHLVRETMASLESRLPSKKFMRISRSTIVNIERIKELQPMFHGEYSVILRNGTRLTLSRSYRDKLQQLLGNLSRGSA